MNVGCATHDPLALAKTPEQRRFIGLLLAVESMTELELEAAVAACPVAVRERLARGPHMGRYACGVCNAFGEGFYRGTPEPEAAMWRAWTYHEVPKLKVQHRNQCFYGELANENYRRTLATYRAAGWDGEAADPDA